ncbi:MAG TPA: hypothetical protein VG164_05450 [Trebonia sp.]|jgi:AraC family transcriptional regulator of adaptative response / DNA-3-methyladenine glycosylase II|nr:hypothetical protein [Trebonia sp.]
MPRARARSLTGLAAALASGAISLHPGADREAETARLRTLPGIGPWTASYIAMRALADPDAFLPADVGVLRGLRLLGADVSLSRDPAGVVALAGNWRPWRSYAVHHLWALLEQLTSPAPRPSQGVATK